MALDEPKESEQPLEVNGVGVLLEDAIKPFVSGAKIDYVKEAGGEGFVLSGPGGC